MGFSINTLTLFGLVLAIGLVVDDAIVVVEAAEHHIGHGMAPREAMRRAMREVAGPVVGIALVLVSVFIPVAFMGGITGLMIEQFALTLVAAVAISAFNALSLSPALGAMLLRPRGGRSGLSGRAGAGFDRAFAALTDVYVRASRWLIGHLGVTFAALVVLASLAATLARQLPVGFIPEEDNGYGILVVQLPDAASMQRTRAVFDKVAMVLDAQPGISGYNEIMGYNLATGVSASYLGSSFLTFAPWDERRGPGLKAAEIIESLNRAFAEILEAKVVALGPPAIPGLGAAGGLSLMLQDRQGMSFEVLSQATREFVKAAQARPELSTVTANFAPGVPQIFVDVDKDKVLKQGVPLRQVYSALQAYLGGVYVNDFTRFGRQWKVYIEAEPAYRVQPEDLRQFYVRNNRGDMVPLSSFTSLRQVEGPEFTSRFNLYRAVEVMASAAPGTSSGQAMAALEEVAREILPPEMGTAWNGLAYQQKRAEGGAAGVLALSMLCVFLVLAALYESWSLPFSVLLTTPIAIFGAFVGLSLRGLENNVYAQIGLVMLVGLAAKNAILIVEFARREQDAGKSPVEAALAGARLRLRPIVMTSLAFILGCAPLWTASGAGAISRRILGTVVISGMLAATLIGLFVVPALYVAVERLVAWWRPASGPASRLAAPAGG